MKRSEMIKILDSEIAALYGASENNTAAAWILKRLEKLGMLPPEISRHHTQEEIERREYYPQDIDGYKIANEWEPEE